jgi:hypothetical protein
MDTIQDLMVIRDRLERLNKEQQMDIFYILYNNGIQYSENKNGIFVNLSTVDVCIIQDILKYLFLKQQQETVLDDAEKQKEMFKMKYFSEMNEDDKPVEVVKETINLVQSLNGNGSEPMAKMEDMIQLKKRRGRKPKQQ